MKKRMSNEIRCYNLREVKNEGFCVDIIHFLDPPLILRITSFDFLCRQAEYSRWITRGSNIRLVVWGV